ncbi:Phosphatidylglycerophosphatase and protein-tyrosine phosphatase 1, partial [Perkinsus olseni]
MLTSPQWQRTLTAAGRHRVSPSRTPKRWFFSKSRPNRATTSAWVDGFFSNGMESIANSSPLWVMKIVSEVLFWPTFAWNYLLYIRSNDDWYSTIAELPTGGKLLLGPAPVFASMRETLVEQAGVSVFVSTLDRDFAGPSVESRSFPMTDFVSPDLPTVEAAVDYIDEQLEAGKSVYVHCKAGKGRSGTIVICWLMKHFRMTPEDAQAYLAKARPQILKVLYKREVVREY